MNMPCRIIVMVKIANMYQPLSPQSRHVVGTWYIWTFWCGMCYAFFSLDNNDWIHLAQLAHHYIFSGNHNASYKVGVIIYLLNGWIREISKLKSQTIYRDIQKGRDIVLCIHMCLSVGIHRQAMTLFYTYVSSVGRTDRPWHCSVIHVCVRL